MKTGLVFWFVLASLVLVQSCSPDYSASPSSAANSGGNPLNTSTPSYNWSGTGAPYSATITRNRVTTNWVSDAASVSYYFESPYNVVTGNIKGKQILTFKIAGLNVGGTARTGWNNWGQYLSFEDSLSQPSKFMYTTFLAQPEIMGTGGIKLLKNDTFLAGTPGYIEALFFGEAQDSVGRIISISNGYLNVRKW